jgi:hypothetical protein
MTARSPPPNASWIVISRSIPTHAECGWKEFDTKATALSTEELERERALYRRDRVA